MVINRIGVLLLICALFSHSLSLSASFSTPDNKIEAWQSAYLDNMSPQELQITANIIYLLYANSIIEMKIRQFATPITRLHQAIRGGIETYKNVSSDIATLKTLLDRLAYVTGTRTVYAQTLSTCMAEYSKNPTLMIDSAFTALQLDAQAKLRVWADAQMIETAQQLQKSSNLINDTIQHWQSAASLHQEMSKGLMPIEISPENEVNKSLIALSIILKNNPELLSINEEIINTLNHVTDHATLLIQAGIDIYKDYYKAIYNKIMSPSVEQIYASTLFSMYGMLPTEYQTVLPDADHVFEHALQTTKMYTQTEFSPL